ncbi:hypothetical protein K523DRAFT_415584 [Schizophyllum commune Tattone D]|nr:hypothetical protein K523DRAFT_415584 [Schizophyllum commune Tattone D]
MSRRPELPPLAPQDDDDAYDIPRRTQEVGSLSSAALNALDSSRRTAGLYAAYSTVSPTTSRSTTPAASSLAYAARRAYNVPRGSPPSMRTPTSSSYRQAPSSTVREAVAAASPRLAPEFDSDIAERAGTFDPDDAPYRATSSRDSLSTDNPQHHDSRCPSGSSSSSAEQARSVVSPTDPDYLSSYYLIERPIFATTREGTGKRDDKMQIIYKEHDGYSLPPRTNAYSTASEPNIPRTVTHLELIFHPFLPFACHDDPIEKVSIIVRKHDLPIEKLVIRVYSHVNRREEPEIRYPGRPRMGFKNIKRLEVIGEGLGLRRLFEQLVDAQAWEVRGQIKAGVANPIQVEEIYFASTIAKSEERSLRNYVKERLPGTVLRI